MTTVTGAFIDALRILCKENEVALVFEDVTICADGTADIWEVRILGD